MKRIVVLISGQGSNLRALVKACADEAWPASVVGVLSSREQAPGLRWAHESGLATKVVDPQSYPDRTAADQALDQAVASLQPDLIVLAGYMRLLAPEFVTRHQGRLLNVHPSLLPSFAGLQTHRRVLEAGCTVTGATVHFVTAELDRGPIVVQGVVPVRPADDESSLRTRVLACEHLILPLAVRWAVDGELRIEGSRVHQREGRAQHLFLDL